MTLLWLGSTRWSPSPTRSFSQKYTRPTGFNTSRYILHIVSAWIFPVLRLQIRNPRSSHFFKSGIQDKKIRIRDHIFESLWLFRLKIHKLFVNLMLWIRIRDPVPFSPLDPGWKIRIWDKHPGSATLIFSFKNLCEMLQYRVCLVSYYKFVLYSTLRKNGNS